jgi:hypothetical protein
MYMADENELSGREKQQMLGQLEQYFVDVTGLPLPPRDTTRERNVASVRWWQPLIYFLKIHDYDLAATKVAVRNAVQHMRLNKLTMSAPASIYEVLVSQYAEKKTGGNVIW